MKTNVKLVAGMDLYTLLTEDCLQVSGSDKKAVDKARTLVKFTFMALVTETPLEQVAIDTGSTVDFITSLANGIKEVLPRLVYSTVVGCDDATDISNTTVGDEYYMVLSGANGYYHRFGKFPTNVSAEDAFNAMLETFTCSADWLGHLEVKQFSLIKPATVPPIGTPLGSTND